MERRRLKRRTLIYYLRVFDRETGLELGHVVDVTMDGVLVMSEAPIDVGRAFALAMRLPSAEGPHDYVEFDAVSVRSARDVNHDFIDTAFRVIGLSPHHRNRLETLIDDHGFRD